MKEAKKEWEELKASRPKTLLMSKRSLVTVFDWAYILPKKIQFNKMNKSS